MKIIKEPASFKELWEKRETEFTEIIKIVVDIEKKILAIDAELHADLEALLLENGSQQKNLWGANLNHFKEKSEFIEYISFINIRPSLENRSMLVEDIEIRRKIEAIVENLIMK
jgi:hypothetical protein